MEGVDQDRVCRSRESERGCVDQERAAESKRARVTRADMIYCVVVCCRVLQSVAVFCSVSMKRGRQNQGSATHTG